MTDTLTRVQSAIAAVLGCDTPAPDAVILDLGGDSLDTVEIVMSLEEAFNLELPDDLVSADDLTVAGLAAVVDGLLAAKGGAQ